MESCLTIHYKSYTAWTTLIVCTGPIWHANPLIGEPLLEWHHIWKKLSIFFFSRFYLDDDDLRRPLLLERGLFAFPDCLIYSTGGFVACLRSSQRNIREGQCGPVLSSWIPGHSLLLLRALANNICLRLSFEEPR
jgi:hypothetical protein